MPANLPHVILQRGWALVKIAQQDHGYEIGAGKPVQFPVLGSTIQSELDAVQRMIIVADTKPAVPDLGIYLYVDPNTARIYKSSPDNNEWQQVNEVDEMFTDPI